MTRRIVYGISLWVFLAATALTIASIALPNWISYTSPSSTSPNPGNNDPIHISYGLHVRCSSLTGQCTHFPQPEDCHGQDRYFCSMWRTVGFLMNFTIVVELATAVSFAVVLIGGRVNREGGWKMCSGLMSVITAAQLIAMAIVAYLHDHDARFSIGWKLDTSTILCTVSWVTLALNAAGLVGAAYLLPPEDDYEEIQ